MPEPQPWRNPRPAPHLPEIRARLRRPRAPAGLRAWWPALLWAGVIFAMSTDTFSSEHTASVFEPILRWMIRSLTKDQLWTIHHYIRKSAHLAEYFVFYLLLYRGVRGDGRAWRWTWGIAALFCAAGYSILDEIHQAFVASRTASPYDSLLDATGAFAAFSVLWMWYHRRRSTGEMEITSSDVPPA